MAVLFLCQRDDFIKQKRYNVITEKIRPSNRSRFSESIKRNDGDEFDR